MAYEPFASGPPFRPTGLLIDVGGVLLLPDPAVLADVLSGWSVELDTEGYDARSYYLGAAALDAAIGVGADWRKSGYGTHLTSLGLPPEYESDAVDALLVRTGFWTRPIASSVSGLGVLVEAQIPVGIVSNADGTVEEQLRTSGICQLGPGELTAVDAIIDSGVIGLEKPDARIFHRGAEAIGCEHERCIYVGDLIYFDVAGAWGAGLWPIHFDPFHVCPHRGSHDHVKELADVLDLDWDVGQD